jgi:hypothetical protein
MVHRTVLTCGRPEPYLQKRPAALPYPSRGEGTNSEEGDKNPLPS